MTSEESEKQMQRYLVVSNPNTGIAQLSNVCVVDAEDEDDAVEKVRDMNNPSNHGRLNVYDIDDLPDVWSYYT